MTGDEQEKWMIEADADGDEPLTWPGCLSWILAGFGLAGLVISALVLTWWVGA